MQHEGDGSKTCLFDLISRNKKIAFLGTLALVVLLFVLSIALLFSASLSSVGALTQVQRGELQRALTPSRWFEPVDVLLIGVDKHNQAGRRSDTLILGRFDLIRRRVAFVSIPRDTNVGWLSKSVPSMRPNGDGGIKINKTYAQGGPALTVKTVEELMQVPIHGVIEVDFDGFVEAIDALGGVTVNVPVAINDSKAANHTPGSRARKIASGVQHLDGEHALTFVRSRQYVDADFSRMRSQQQFIRALAQRCMSLGGFIRLPAAASALRHNASGVISPSQTLLLGMAIACSGPSRTSNQVLKGVWVSPYVQLDVNGLKNVRRSLSRWSQILPAPGDVRVLVLNSTETPHLANNVARQLNQRGYRIAGVGNANDISTRGIVLLCRDETRSDAERLKKEFKSARIRPSLTEEQYSRADVVVILCNDPQLTDMGTE